VELPRPTTHHLTAALLTAVDARPSDAIALALVTGAPLLVDAAVLEEAAKPDPEWADERAAADTATDGRRVLAGEVRARLSRP
jgi:bifunctional DNase/RNase